MGDISRRKFVSTVAGAGAAITIVPRHVLGHGIQAPSDTVNIESRLASHVPRFAAHGMATHLLGAWDEEVGHAQLIAIGDDGELAVATDPRADGSVATLP